MTESNVFSDGDYDRQAPLRKNADRLQQIQTRSDARFLVSWDDQSPVCWRQDQPVAAWLTPEQVAGWREAVSELIWMGADTQGRPQFGLLLNHRPDGELPFVPTYLREIGALLGAPDANALAWFRALGHWHRNHTFCSRCAAQTVSDATGHERRCRGCGARHFPRVDPAIIVLVEHDERCLLGTQAKWAPSHYSTLAGFVEPGESLENAVRREVFEEAGVTVGAMRYHSSQPWPFPQSLMVGFTARARTTAITLRDDELRNARWFTRDAMDAALAAGSLRLPSDASIALRLIRAWYERQGRRLPPRTARCG